MYITFSLFGQGSIFAFIDQCLLYFLRKLNSKYKKMIGLKSTRAISNQFIYQSKSSSRQGHIRRLGFFLSVLKQKFSKFYLLYTSETCCQSWHSSRLWSSAVSRNVTSISSMFGKDSTNNNLDMAIKGQMLQKLYTGPKTFIFYSIWNILLFISIQFKPSESFGVIWCII